MLYRLSRSGVHLLASALVAAAIALVVFKVWYPTPLSELSGGFRLFGILVFVDLFLGPLATLVVSSPTKSRREWRNDMAVIVVLQTAAVSYGIWTIFQARPVFLAFEFDRIRVVSAADVDLTKMQLGPIEFQTLPVDGPKLIALRPFKSSAEGADATLAALQGAELSFRPDFWMPYEHAKSEILTAARPISELIVRKPAQKITIDEVLRKNEMLSEQAVYLPLHGRSTVWTALIDPINGKPVAYMPIDPY